MTQKTYVIDAAGWRLNSMGLLATACPHNARKALKGIGVLVRMMPDRTLEWQWAPFPFDVPPYSDPPWHTYDDDHIEPIQNSIYEHYHYRPSRVALLQGARALAEEGA